MTTPRLREVGLGPAFRAADDATDPAEDEHVCHEAEEAPGAR